MTQQALPLDMPIDERDYHAFEPQRYDGAMDTPLGCKRCNRVLWAPIHGLPAAIVAAPERGRE